MSKTILKKVRVIKHDHSLHEKKNARRFQDYSGNVEEEVVRKPTIAVKDHAKGKETSPQPIEKKIDFEQQLREEYKRGNAEGFETGKKAAVDYLQKEFDRQVKETRESLIALSKSINEEYQQFQRNMERIILRLAIAIAEKIIKKSIVEDSSIVISQVREALKRVLGVERLKIRVHPDDEVKIREARENLMASVDSLKEILLEVDEKVDRGDCILESESGNVDARLSTQLRTLTAALEELV